jgi:protein TonB
MNAITYSAWHPRHLGLVIIFTALINGLLFAALPWLTQVVDREWGIEKVSPYIVLPKRQPKISELERNRKIPDRKPQPPPKPTLLESAKQKLRHDFGFLTGKGGVREGVQVEILDPGIVSVDPKEYIFDPSQLDKAPHLIQKVPPIYPFDAKRQGLTGWVMIRCLVDKDGLAIKINAVESDPPDALDIFGPSAVDAVKKWRFSPGEMGGDPVPTRVVFRVIFELD